MSASQQLEYVEKYYSPYAGKLNSPADLYLATFYPYAIGKSPDFVVGSQISLAEAREIARQNPGIQMALQLQPSITMYTLKKSLFGIFLK